jgi:hypothetical protein
VAGQGRIDFLVQAFFHLWVPGQQVQRPAERVGGGVGSAGEEDDHLVGDLRVGELRCTVVVRCEQHRQRIPVISAAVSVAGDELGQHPPEPRACPGVGTVARKGEPGQERRQEHAPVGTGHQVRQVVQDLLLIGIAQRSREQRGGGNP